MTAAYIAASKTLSMETWKLMARITDRLSPSFQQRMGLISNGGDKSSDGAKKYRQTVADIRELAKKWLAACARSFVAKLWECWSVLS